jgi:viroplasmin and RNaseH domain-containing protein
MTNTTKDILDRLEPFVHGLGKAILAELRETTAQPFGYWVNGHGTFESKEVAEAWAKEEGTCVVPLYTSPQYTEQARNHRKNK